MSQEIQRMIRLPGVKVETTKARSTVYKEMNEGLFPRPVKISERSVAWLTSDIAALNEARICGKSDGEIRDLVTRLHNARGTTVTRQA